MATDFEPSSHAAVSESATNPTVNPDTNGLQSPDTQLERNMESRHLTMISLGGVIGTGLFLSSGYTIH